MCRIGRVPAADDTCSINGRGKIGLSGSLHAGQAVI
jgi:hypothetical protein